jgi:hypothetical protein
LPVTEGAEFPFWSPDSRSIGFFAAGKLKRLAIAGGPPIVITPASSQPLGASWNQEGTILFALVAGEIRRVSASGGTPVAVTAVDRENEENSHRFPLFLPDGRRFLYYVQSGKPHVAGIYLGSLDQPKLKARVVESTTNGLYLPPRGKRSGLLLWLRGNALTAQPFDLDHGRLTGEPASVPGAETVSWASAIELAHFSSANDGTMLFTRGSDNYQPTWYSREGRQLSTVGRPDRFLAIRLAPDGERAVVTIVNVEGMRDFLTLDLVRGVTNRLTTGGLAAAAVWSPDGRWIGGHRLNAYKLFEVPASGAEQLSSTWQGLPPRRVALSRIGSPATRL